MDYIDPDEIDKAYEIINLYIQGQEPPLEDLDWAIQTAYYHYIKGKGVPDNERAI